MHVSDSFFGTAKYPCSAPTAFSIKQTLSTDWLWTARPRLGFAGGPVLVYGTAGVAMTNYNYTSVFNDTFATAHESAAISEIRTGWAAGRRLEFQVGKGRHW